MKKQLLRFILLLVTAMFVFTPFHADAEVSTQTQDQRYSQSEAKLRFDLRKLWIDHTIWTRGYIVSSLAGLEDQDRVLVRLLKNQEDIGNAIKPYYGNDAGNKLAKLLKEHIILAGKVVEAAKSGNKASLDKYNKEWYKNADDIAQFLSSANPNWSKQKLKNLLYVHLQLVTDQAVARIKKDWTADILAFDKGEDHIIVLADAITDGIVKQFPNKFR
ncbi:glycosyl transferase [Ectobacillus panaciterrae]|uniref:glycosyl transferase n=1 Tax=Ectobacillus panaciterrae TaxID=363872 RepID=UPI00041C3B56|nr:glycosyl transferase [Ectobacillus panaciterrae]